ncbi:cytochrome b/b6 domain-containing protein [Pseudodonghicola flavimaris]|uniref:Cytochrome b/b6 domain-containing protein n=1 Tax=Pseudodonghicola flavimaris TaxID=3050036 RepID=A0ABT7EZ85_9RHOB|nr:cytochrome b/b6 domain-containing protein [Pseudodonghicola flavimaris]MDK3017564.1 cytochrome b/b6 domain-containing protein [Pseudodonghicola flavimaris]
MTRTRVWDPAVRLFHWSLVAGFAANALFVDEESKLHHWIGYFVVGLVVFRILWGLVGSRYARFSSFPPSLSGAVGQMTDIATHRTHPHVGHSPLGALMIYNLILTLLAIGLTGYLMTTDMFWGVEGPEELHEAFVTWAEISVVAHIAAVAFESRRTKVNLARAMITGYKDLPES